MNYIKLKRSGVDVTISEILFPSAPSEWNITLSIGESTPNFFTQASRLLSVYRDVVEEYMPYAIPVHERYYLSDIENQQSELERLLESDNIRHYLIIEQPPLGGGKIAMWAQLQSGVENCNVGDVVITQTGRTKHLRSKYLSTHHRGSRAQTRDYFVRCSETLNEFGLSLQNNCIRTWLFVQDIDNAYKGVVVGRNEIFVAQGLNSDTHFIASTGIAGRGSERGVYVTMEAYSVEGIEPQQIGYLYAPTHLNRTSEYGVSFERGTVVKYGDRDVVIISGTASIDNRGRILHPGDIVKQTYRMIDNIDVLLKEADCSSNDITHIIVYLRDITDYPTVKEIIEGLYPMQPVLFLWAPVCRPGWLIEMECMALKRVKQREYQIY